MAEVALDLMFNNVNLPRNLGVMVGLGEGSEAFAIARLSSLRLSSLGNMQMKKRRVSGSTVERRTVNEDRRSEKWPKK